MDCHALVLAMTQELKIFVIQSFRETARHIVFLSDFGRIGRCLKFKKFFVLVGLYGTLVK